MPLIVCREIQKYFPCFFFFLLSGICAFQLFNFIPQHLFPSLQFNDSQFPLSFHLVHSKSVKHYSFQTHGKQKHCILCVGSILQNQLFNSFFSGKQGESFSKRTIVNELEKKCNSAIGTFSKAWSLCVGVNSKTFKLRYH